jgi:hypothetical protein
MYLKVHEHSRGKIVAACDKELIGKVLSEGEVVLDLEKYSSFYVGKPAGKKQLAEAMKGALSINLVGEKAVSVAIGEKLSGQNDVKYINGIPHMQVFRV